MFRDRGCMLAPFLPLGSRQFVARFADFITITFGFRFKVPDGSRFECHVTEQAITDEELPVIARFEVRRRSYLAPDGTVLRRLPHFASDTSALLSLFRGMVLTRAFDTKCLCAPRRLGTYAVSLGQEAVSIGIASAMREEDVFLPSLSDNAALLWRGVKMGEILLYWGGDEHTFSG